MSVQVLSVCFLLYFFCFLFVSLGWMGAGIFYVLIKHLCNSVSRLIWPRLRLGFQHFKLFPCNLPSFSFFLLLDLFTVVVVCFWFQHGGKTNKKCLFLVLAMYL